VTRLCSSIRHKSLQPFPDVHDVLEALGGLFRQHASDDLDAIPRHARGTHGVSVQSTFRLVPKERPAGQQQEVGQPEPILIAPQIACLTLDLLELMYFCMPSGRPGAFRRLRLEAHHAR